MFKEHPKGLLVLALTNMGERFGYYTMLAILALYMQAKFGLSSAATSAAYGTFLAMVYFLPLFGGFVADKVLGYGRTILLGIIVMFSGYLLLALPTEANMAGKIMMFCALALISLGTGFFKGNLQALVGNLYESDIYKGKRDIAFSIFYMFINIGAFFAPSVANTINNTFLAKENFTYDAAIAKSYVALNDRLVDKEAFINEVYAMHPGKEHNDELVRKEKKRQGVMFESDRESNLFRLKAAGLMQLTQAGAITDPAMAVTTGEYALLDSRNPNDRPVIDLIKERISAIQVTDPALYGDQADPAKFATNFGENYVNKALIKSYNLAFGVACLSLIISVLIFLLFRRTWKAVDKTHKQQIQAAAKGEAENVVTLTAHEVRERMIALGLVFCVVIFFWMSFHQNGLCMTFFARDYTTSSITPVHNMAFSLLGLLPFIVVMYGIYMATMGLFGAQRKPTSGIVVALVGIAGMIAYYMLDVQAAADTMVKITPQIFQQFNPLFIVVLTPLAVALFSALAKRNREPSAPRKIGYGMLIAALGFVILMVASMGLPAPASLDGISDTLVSPNWLISSYLVLTMAELFLSPMGLSFVAKVAPPQYKGMMQGGWLAATAIGNLLVGVMGIFWEKLALYAFWGILVLCCLLSAAFLFSVMKRLEKATA